MNRGINERLNSTEKARVLDAIVGKLLCEGVTPANYSEDSCRGILSHCVLSSKLIELYNANEPFIFDEITKEFA